MVDIKYEINGQNLSTYALIEWLEYKITSYEQVINSFHPSYGGGQRDKVSERKRENKERKKKRKWKDKNRENRKRFYSRSEIL